MLRLILLLGLILAPMSAADLTRLRIVITDQAGKPVDRASVIVKFQGHPLSRLGVRVRKSWEMKSSQEGIAKIPALPQGKILVQIIAQHYQTFGQVFDVDEEEKTIEIKLNPPQPQYSAH
jgi:hypothetical protein